MSWLQQKTKSKTWGWCALAWQVSTTCNSQWHTQTHTPLPGSRSVCILKEPRHTKTSWEKHTLTQSSTLYLLVVTCRQAPPLVSQWTLLQPSWRMTQSDVSPATNMGDWTRWRKGDTHNITSTDSKPFTHLKQSWSLAPDTLSKVKIQVLVFKNKNLKPFQPNVFLVSTCLKS